ncbi:HNH endonuclease [Noviherbaspirillum sp. CPCC 100848]|uniref:HNH endonuclease n=1 Tax=Noviherbaspirillum album TaxID=3080276 RepID=A0ABU6JHU2_9BURK|nr:HNH endonuclease [Noviherbaspirillum sp. CPCC 100848]MEC4722772.1 HNH endonuclease [Noviherbaspirillum sp. CPCC 100848]
MAQEGKCLHCGEPLTTDDLLDQHHLKERHAGGDDKKDNLVLLHTICHKQIHHLGIMLVKPGPGRTGPLSKRDLTKEA